MSVIYGAWWNETYYHDDGPSTSSERLLDADTCVDTLRDRVNAYFAQSHVINHYRNQLLVVGVGKLESTQYSSSGGGCYATGKVTLKPVSRLELKGATT